MCTFMMMVVTHITHQIKIMPLFKIWCISRISFYPFYFWILPKLSFIQFSHPLALRAHLMSYSAYSCGISVRMWECVRADIPHMCINGVIPREIKCMSRRNMHILPQKNSIYCVSREGGREWEWGWKWGIQKQAIWVCVCMLKRAFSGEAVENIV